MELIHGGDIYSARERQRAEGRAAGHIVDFSANINPLGVPGGVLEAMRGALANCICYPDPLCRELTQALAHAEGLPPEWVLCGNGASDLIYRLAFALRPKKALLAAPCFAEYEQALEAAGCAVRRHILREENGFALTDAFLEALTDDVDMVFLCSPNNPTGVPVEPALLERILKRCAEKSIFFALDECFVDFLDEPERWTLKHRLAEHENLLILRAFTKLYAIPGVRLGQCYCSNAALLEKMYACGSPWSVSVLAQAAGVAALRETEYVERTRGVVREERAFLRAGLAALGVTVVGSQANYIFFKAPQSGILLALGERGILLRSCNNYPGLAPGWLRAAVRSHADNRLLLGALEEVLACR